METLKGPKGSRVLNPTLQISPMRYTAKGKPAAQGALLPALPSRGEKILHNHFVGDGGRYQKQDREDQETRTLDSGSPSGVQPSAGVSGSCASSQKRQTGEGGRVGAWPCCYLCSSCSCIPFGLYTPGTTRAWSN